MATTELDKVLGLIKEQWGDKKPSLEEMRTGLDMLGVAFPAHDDLVYEDIDAGGVPALAISGGGDDEEHGTVLFLHGGGYCLGSPKSHCDLASRICKAASARVLSVDYRLAPENPFPASVEDATTAYEWLLSEGLPPEAIVVAGDSAGGGLTVAMLVALKERGTALPAAAVCISPWVDLEGLGESMTTKADVDPMIQRDGLVGMGKLYLGGADARTPLAAPLYADLSGLPPLLIHVGSCETLLDDALRLTEKARAAGVDVELDVWEDMFHVWHIYAPMLTEGQEAIDRIGEFVRARIT